MLNEKPLVSVYCLAYNHEKYIRQCLDGFVNQKASFSFEVIVHDDASTDHTQEIIREYEARYPEIIHGIYQTENQRQKKVPKLKTFILPLVKGKYVAICEGDDYWTDDNKLQSQVDLMEQNQDAHFCVCGVQEVSENGRILGISHPSIDIEETIIPSTDFVRYAGTYSFQTSSYLMRTDDWKEYVLNPPEFRKVSDIGDLPILLYFGSMGNTVYVNRFMSCYRRGAPTSYSAKKNNWTEEKRIAHFEKAIKVWGCFDQYSKGFYHEVCAEKISQNMFGYALLRLDAKSFLKNENKEYYYKLPLPKQGYILLACVLKKVMKKHYLNTQLHIERKELEAWARAE